MPDAPSIDPTANGQGAASPAKATEHAPDNRIAELREQILDGSYTVDSNRLSAKIVDEHLEK